MERYISKLGRYRLDLLPTDNADMVTYYLWQITGDNRVLVKVGTEKRKLVVDSFSYSGYMKIE